MVLLPDELAGLLILVSFKLGNLEFGSARDVSGPNRNPAKAGSRLLLAGGEDDCTAVSIGGKRRSGSSEIEIVSAKKLVDTPIHLKNG